MIALPQDVVKNGEAALETVEEFRKHPLFSAKMLGMHERLSADVINAVALHHERWDGSGYPKGLAGEETPLGARIIAVADTYYEMVSRRPGRNAYMPHEAVEYIMAYGGELFDPQLVEVFARQMPLYPTGTSVKLNTGEIGIVSDSNLGFVGRPVVRVCFDEKARAIGAPYDVDLSEAEHQSLLVTQVMDY
jgi:HD-GYP domain-containing protein (c-di-GMP phosphodiesterase class II)